MAASADANWGKEVRNAVQIKFKRMHTGQISRSRYRRGHQAVVFVQDDRRMLHAVYRVGGKPQLAPLVTNGRPKEMHVVD